MAVAIVAAIADLIRRFHLVLEYRELVVASWAFRRTWYELRDTLRSTTWAAEWQHHCQVSHLIAAAHRGSKGSADESDSEEDLP